MTIQNTRNSYRYFNLLDSTLIENPLEFLTVDSISSSNLFNHIHNLSQGVERPDTYLEVVKNIYPIPPSSNWTFRDNKFYLFCQSPKVVNDTIDNLDDFIRIIKSKSNLLKNKKIGVELSGGLDSSIIIELLNLCEIDILLIGLKSSNFEFRTERKIQDFYANKYKSILIDSKNALPFSKLLECPQHYLPTKKSLFYNQVKTIAKRCADEDVAYLFNGILGDTIFCEKLEMRTWQKWEFDNNWLNDFVFKPENVTYITTNFKFVLDYIFKLRMNKGSDPYKIWARDHFKRILPPTLSEYYYKTDHFEEILEGVYLAEKEIVEIYKFAKDITKYNQFSVENISCDLKTLKRMNSLELNAFFAKASFAVWIYSLRNII